MPKTSSKPRAKKARTTKPAAAEPEVLGDDTHDGHRAPLLDALEDVLAGANDFTLAARLAIQEAFGGKCDAAREVEVLKMVKGDSRFRIIPGHGGEPNRIALAADEAQEGASHPTESASALDDGAVTPADSHDASQQTLGDLVKDAAGRPMRIPWQHDIGSHVLLLTDGHPPRKATIKNIHTSGNSSFYDLVTESGGETNDVPAYRIGRDLDAEGEIETMRMRCAALERHIARGATLAQKIVVKQAEERTQAETLSKLRKEIEALYGELADHERSEPGQTDIRDVVGDGNPTPRGERMSSDPSDDEDVLADEDPKTVPLVPIPLERLGVDLEQLHAARVERATSSTGKPPKVKPIVVEGHQLVLADVQDGVAVLFPVVDADTWEAKYRDRFGTVLALPSDHQPTALAAGGPLCGSPVKVGRATRWIGPAADAVLIRLPEPEPRAVGKDAAAGA